MGLLDSGDNQKGLIHDIVVGQLRFGRAFFLRKWSAREGVLTSEEIDAIEAANPGLRPPAALGID